MSKLTNKQHEQQQNASIKKLKNDLKQQKNRIEKIEKRIDALTNRKTSKKKVTKPKTKLKK